MSAADLLKAEGREEGREEGRKFGFLMGGIQAMQGILDLPESPVSELKTLNLEELETRHSILCSQFEARLKNR